MPTVALRNFVWPRTRVYAGDRRDGTRAERVPSPIIRFGARLFAGGHTHTHRNVRTVSANWDESVLIDGVLRPGCGVLDICCGKVRQTSTVVSRKFWPVSCAAVAAGMCGHMAAARLGRRLVQIRKRQDRILGGSKYDVVAAATVNAPWTI